MENLRTLVAASTLLCASTATAIPIEGGISFVGNPPSAFDFDIDANTVDFDDGGNNAKVASVNGDYSSFFSVGDTVTFFDFMYDTFSGPAKIWEATSSTGDIFSFYLETIDSVVENSVSALSTSVLISGHGFVESGDDDLLSVWNISLNSADDTFSFSSSTASKVSEPGTMILFGFGLAGVFAARKIRKQA